MCVCLTPNKTMYYLQSKHPMIRETTDNVATIHERSEVETLPYLSIS